MAGIVVPTEEEPGGGGGFYSIPGVSSESQVSINLPGFDVYGSGGTEPKWEHTYTYDNGETNSHIHEKNAHGGINFILEQGAFGRHWLPIKSDMDIRRYDDKGYFGFGVEFYLLAVDEKLEWQDPPSSNIYFDLFGLNYSASAHIEHDMHGYWDEEAEKWYEVQTSDIRGNFWFNFENAETSGPRLSIYPYTRSYNNVEYEGMRIEGSFDVIYTGPELGILNSAIPVEPIPEPATLLFLVVSAGTLVLKRRR